MIYSFCLWQVLFVSDAACIRKCPYQILTGLPFCCTRQLASEICSTSETHTTDYKLADIFTIEQIVTKMPFSRHATTFHVA